MEDTYAIFYDNKLLVILTGFDGPPLPDRFGILDWYAKNYSFERHRLTGGYCHSVSVQGMKYEDFREPKGQKGQSDPPGVEGVPGESKAEVPEGPCPCPSGPPGIKGEAGSPDPEPAGSAERSSPCELQ